MIDPRYEVRIANGEAIEEVLRDREPSEGVVIRDVLQVWIEHTELIIASNNGRDAIEHVERELPDLVDDELRAAIIAESNRRALIEEPREPLREGSHFGPTLTDGRGRYRIEAMVAEGSQGWVYRAIDRKFRNANRSRVAIKVHKNPDAVRSVRVQSIDHPHVVRVHDHDIDLHGNPVSYIVYEFLEGDTLEDWALKHSPRLNDVVEILMQICLGVQAIHTLPIVHRDLKPSNIIMVNGRPVIADFGIAAHADDDQSVAGSPMCMAPEQLTHDADSTLVDIYGIGAIAFFLLTGGYPNGQSEAESLTFLASSDEVDLSEVPKRIRHILKRCLARSPADRYQSAEAVRIALDDLRSFRSRSVPSEAVVARSILFIRRHTMLVSTVTLLIAIGVTAMATTIMNQREVIAGSEKIRMSNEAMKNAMQMTIIDARFRHDVLDPATYWSIVELSEQIPDWEIWASAAIVKMDGDLELREEVERRTRDTSTSRITAAYWWWLLANVQRAAGRPKSTYSASFEQARHLLVSKLGQDDPLIAQLDRDAARESSSP